MDAAQTGLLKALPDTVAIPAELLARRFCRHFPYGPASRGLLPWLLTILQALERKRVAVRILDLGMDTQTPTGKLMVTVLGGVAQFEREMMLERHGKASPKLSRLANRKAENQSLQIDISMFCGLRPRVPLK